MTVILGLYEKEKLFSDYPPPWTEETLETISDDLGIFFKDVYLEDMKAWMMDEFYIIDEKKWMVAKLKYGL